MHNGHRGINHPVKNLITGKGEISSQNHGFAISLEETESNNNIEITHVHLNDNTIAGIKIKNKIVSLFNTILKLVLAHTIQLIFSINLLK
jgi:carbamoyl-phosphate synthase small subunit